MLERGNGQIQAVLFDMDGTLYHQLPVRVLMALELATLLVTMKSIRKARKVWSAIATFRRVREELRSAPTADASLEWLQYAETAKRIASHPDDVERYVTEWMYRRPLKYLRFGRRPGLAAFLDFLEANRIRVGVLSDHPVAEKLEALGLASRFSVQLCATDQQVNAFKPHPAGYLVACRLWRLSPSEVLYVGDRRETDAVGAAAAGMRCAIISPFEWVRNLVGIHEETITVPFYGRLRHALNRCC